MAEKVGERFDVYDAASSCLLNMASKHFETVVIGASEGAR